MGSTKCLNCSSELQGKYCSHCGEKVYSEHDKSVSHLFEEALHFLTHFEGKFLTTIKTIFTQPGKLSADYCGGLRQKYFKPASLYFLLIIVYLLFPMARGLNLPLDNFYDPATNTASSNLISKKQQQLGVDYNELKKQYDRKSEKISKFLLIIILPLCAFLIRIIFLRRGGFFFDQFILSAEINSLFLMAIFIIIPILALPFGLWFKPAGDTLFTIDLVMSILAFAILVSYSSVAFRRFFNVSALSALARGIVFSIGQLFVVFFIYRQVLFYSVMAII